MLTTSNAKATPLQSPPRRHVAFCNIQSAELKDLAPVRGRTKSVVPSFSLGGVSWTPLAPVVPRLT